MAPYDVVTMGRVAVELVPQQYDVPLEVVKSFDRFLGGSAANVAVAAARHGRHAAVVSRVGSDAFGRFVRSELLRLGVETEFVTTVDDATPTPLTFCEIHPPDHFPLLFYRHPRTPDLMLEAASLPRDTIRDARVFWATGTGLCQEPSRTAHHAAWEARSGQQWTVLDLDYREAFWPDPAAAAEQLRRALSKVTTVVGTAEECTLVTGEVDPIASAEALLEQGLDLVVVKRGRLGAMALSAEGRVEVPAFRRAMAGPNSDDAFGGALVHGLLSGWDLRRDLNFATIAAALVADRIEGAGAMPASDEVDRLLDDVGLQDEFS